MMHSHPPLPHCLQSWQRQNLHQPGGPGPSHHGDGPRPSGDVRQRAQKDHHPPPPGLRKCRDRSVSTRRAAASWSHQIKSYSCNKKSQIPVCLSGPLQTVQTERIVWGLLLKGECVFVSVTRRWFHERGVWWPKALPPIPLLKVFLHAALCPSVFFVQQVVWFHLTPSWSMMFSCWTYGTRKTKWTYAQSASLQAAAAPLWHRILSVTTITAPCSPGKPLTPGEATL